MSDDPKPTTNKLMDEAADEAKLAEAADQVAESAKKVADKAEEIAEKADTLAGEMNPDRKPKEPRKGVYTLEDGDTPGIVSIKFYGRSHKAVALARANMDCDWQVGSVIDLV